jgi:16S rRNA (cytosine967-C5)-methyltransferase
VIDRKTPLDGLTDDENGHPQYLALSPRDRSLVRAIVLSALRGRGTVARCLSERLDRALPANARALEHLLHVGAAQILFLDVPASAAVDLAAEQAGSDPRLVRFKGLVNAVLRAIAADSQAMIARHGRLGDAPDWFWQRLDAVYGPERRAAILAAHAVEPAVDFTVRSDAARWAETLGGVVLPTGTVRVVSPSSPIPELPGFAEGAWWVQDAAAAIPARLFGPVEGLRVADLCAAPGGKTAQLAAAGAHVTAVDLSENRLRRLKGNLARLGLEAETVVGDLRALAPAPPFDAVLLDAPCSSTGTVRRHPDVPYTKSAEDVAKLARLQRTLLDHAIGLVKPGGTIVFSNCSLDPAEGEEMVAALLAERSDVAREPVGPEEVPGIAGFLNSEGAVRTTPDMLDMGAASLSGLDGFYAVRLRRSR